MSSEANPCRPAGGSRARPAGTSQHYDLAHFHPGQAASSTESLWAALCAECAKTQIALRDGLPRQLLSSADGGYADGLSSGRRRSSVAAFLGRSHPGPGQILASGQLARRASTGAPIRYCLPARQQACFPAACAQACGSLVRNGAEPVHTRWKCWGFRRLVATVTGPLPGKARVASCACRENRSYPHATPQ